MVTGRCPFVLLPVRLSACLAADKKAYAPDEIPAQESGVAAAR
jgi:hypothetical protein